MKPGTVSFLLAAIMALSACTIVRPGGGRESPPSPEPRRPRGGEVSPLPRGPSPWPGAIPDPLPEEVRALWVVRTTLLHPDSARIMVERAHQAGFNTIIVQVRGRGDAYYRSRWEPLPEASEGAGISFDPLALVIREAHARGLGVHAWVNAHLVGGMGPLPSSVYHVIRARPDLLAVPRELAEGLYAMDPFSSGYVEALHRYALENRESIEGIYTSPSHPVVKEHIYSVWMDLVESYPLDGIHFDYIRYPNPEFDYSRGALERFREWVSPRLTPARREELDRMAQLHVTAWADALPGPWDEFRRAQITDLVERVYHGVKKRRRDVVVSAAVFANAEDAVRSRYQDWPGWIRDGILDAVVPMAYTPDNEAFRAQIQDAVQWAGGDRVWAGIGVYRNTFRGTLDKIRIARELGARGFSLFSYDWAVSEGERVGRRSLLDRIGREVFDDS